MTVYTLLLESVSRCRENSLSKSKACNKRLQRALAQIRNAACLQGRSNFYLLGIAALGWCCLMPFIYTRHTGIHESLQGQEAGPKVLGQDIGREEDVEWQHGSRLGQSGRCLVFDMVRISGATAIGNYLHMPLTAGLRRSEVCLHHLTA